MKQDKPLTVLITDPHRRGGGQVSYVSLLAEKLAAAGHRAIIGGCKDSVLVERGKRAGVEVFDGFTFARGLRIGAWMQDIAAMRWFIRDQQPDVVHVSGSQDHWVAALANRSLGSPICIVRTRHNSYPVHDGLTNRILNRRWTDYQIVLGEGLRGQLAKQKAFELDRLHLVRNGVDPDMYRPNPAARKAARAEFGYTDDHIVVGIAARLVVAKGHEYLIKAVAQLRDEFPQLRVLALGEGQLRNELEQMAAEHGVADRFYFAGFNEDMPRCIQAIDIGTLPSVECDVSSFVVKEQMAAEIPMIVSDHGGLPEDVNDGVEGFVVPAGQVEPLAEAIRTLAGDPQKRAAMGKAGRERVLREYTIDTFINGTVEAYRRACALHEKG